MRVLGMLVISAVFCGLLGLAEGQTVNEERLSARDIGDLLRTLQKPPKPGATPAATGGYRGTDTCRYANDGECDDPGIGTGACAEFTDYSDCWRIATGVEDDSCQWANDGECDEPGLGTGACTQATDYTDCVDVIPLRGQSDQCETAFDGVCNDPETGDGSCASNTDRSDCIGRERPLTISDHFFGYDDRVLLDTAVFPWSVIGFVNFDEGGTCTATLVGPDILITAAHCIADSNGVDARAEFITAANHPDGPFTARVVDYLMDVDWNPERFNGTDEIDYVDWALLRIDRRLGDVLGHARPGRFGDFLSAIGPNAAGPPPPNPKMPVSAPTRFDLTPRGNRRPSDYVMMQAGYSWDTGEQLSGNLDCVIVQTFNDPTMAHDCDTTRGDSGSPFIVEEDGEYYVIATDSNFRSNPDGPMIYIAVRSEAWIDEFEDFAAGRSGNGGPRPRGPGKPVKLED